MAFNSNTYHANKYRREATAYLAEARDIKARAARGEAYDWELPRITAAAVLARNSAKLARTYDRLRQIERERRSLR